MEIIRPLLEGGLLHFVQVLGFLGAASSLMNHQYYIIALESKRIHQLEVGTHEQPALEGGTHEPTPTKVQLQHGKDPIKPALRPWMTLGSL